MVSSSLPVYLVKGTRGLLRSDSSFLLSGPFCRSGLFRFVSRARSSCVGCGPSGSVDRCGFTCLGWPMCWRISVVDHHLSCPRSGRWYRGSCSRSGIADISLSWSSLRPSSPSVCRGSCRRCRSRERGRCRLLVPVVGAVVVHVSSVCGSPAGPSLDRVGRGGGDFHRSPRASSSVVSGPFSASSEPVR